MGGINWGDVPTWLAVAVATVGGGVALRQLRNQQRELGRQIRQLERQQADAVGVRLKSTDRPPSGTPSTSGSHPCWLVEVSNESRRPVRRVACHLIVPGQGELSAAEMQWYAASAGGSHWKPLATVDAGSDLIRAGTARGFAFPAIANDNPGARFIARFTDDAGLHWQIDHDLHMQKLENRDDW